MKTLAWLTDLHLDFLMEEAVYQALEKQLRQQEADFMVVTGDIATSRDWSGWLETLAEGVPIPLYFVLGNHDFYGSSFEAERRKARALDQRHPRVNWLTEKAIVALTDKTALIGHEGWADGREGDYWNSLVRLRDYDLIQDFIPLDRAARMRRVEDMGREAARVLGERLELALASHQHVVMALHPPPFREASRYEGRPANDDWAPHFVCRSVGEMIVEVMSRYPQQDLLVLCGHAHHHADYQPLPNVRVLAGHAEYGTPRVQLPLQIV